MLTRTNLKPDAQPKIFRSPIPTIDCSDPKTGIPTSPNILPLPNSPDRNRPREGSPSVTSNNHTSPSYVKYFIPSPDPVFDLTGTGETRVRYPLPLSKYHQPNSPNTTRKSARTINKNKTLPTTISSPSKKKSKPYPLSQGLTLIPYKSSFNLLNVRPKKTPIVFSKAEISKI